jgi:hypothetical protein
VDAPPRVPGRVGPVRARHIGVEEERRAHALDRAHRARDLKQREQDRDPDQRDREPEPEHEPGHDDRERRDAGRHVEQEVERVLPSLELKRGSEGPREGFELGAVAEGGGMVIVASMPAA